MMLGFEADGRFTLFKFIIQSTSEELELIKRC